MSILKRLISSLKFRFNYYKKRKQEKKIKYLKQRHQNFMSTISANDFTIISANCWGGSVYEDLKRPYLTPTIGLFFYAPDFIKLLDDFEANINAPLEFKRESKYREANDYREQENVYPIGVINDEIEIHFLHYTSEEEARSKWERRVKRINFDNIYIACTDRDLMNETLLRNYDELPFKNKVVFTSKKVTNINSAVYLKAFKNASQVGDIYNKRYLVTRDFNLKEWLKQ